MTLSDTVGSTASKQCTHCFGVKSLESFHKAAKGAYGRAAKCKQCKSGQIESWRQKHKDAVSLKAKARRQSNYEFYLNKERETRARKREQLREYARAYRRNYIKKADVKPKVRCYIAKRRAAKLQRTPQWTDKKAIQRIYEGCPKGMVVDHIIPLQGKNVSGLHVSWNLQYLTHEENIRKSNKF